MFTLNHKTERSRIGIMSTTPSSRNGAVFPIMSSTGLMGVTMSCSSVPISRSFTIASEVSIMVTMSRIIDDTPGTMKFTLFSSGLYRTRVRSRTPGSRGTSGRIRSNRLTVISPEYSRTTPPT